MGQREWSSARGFQTAGARRTVCSDGRAWLLLQQKKQDVIGEGLLGPLQPCRKRGCSGRGAAGALISMAGLHGLAGSVAAMTVYGP